MADTDPVFVSFSVTGASAAELRRMARRLGYAHVSILPAQLTQIGARVMEERFEPHAELLRRPRVKAPASRRARG